MTGHRKPGIADIDDDPNVEIRPYSSPPCFAHEVDPAYFGLSPEQNDTAAGLQRMLRAAEDSTTILAALLSRQ